MLTGLTAEFHKAALQFTSTDSHCSHWRRKSLRQVCSVNRLWVAKKARSIPDLHPSTLAVSNVVSISRIAAPANDHIRTYDRAPDSGHSIGEGIRSSHSTAERQFPAVWF